MPTRISIFTVVLLALAVTQFAQATSPDFKLEIKSVERYESLRVDADRRATQGVIALMHAKPDVFAVIEMTFQPKWTEATKDNLTIRAENVELTIGDQSYKPIGGLYGGDMRSAFLVYLSPPRDLATPVEPLQLFHCYRIPANATKATLTAGDKTKQISFAGNVLPLPPQNVGATAEVVNTKWHDNIVSTYRFNSEEYPSIRRNPAGRILAVTIKVTPTQANVRGEHLWRTPDITLITPAGQSIYPLGEGDDPGKLSWGYNHTCRFENGKWQQKEATYYYAVPANLKTFKIANKLRVFGEGTTSQ